MIFKIPVKKLSCTRHIIHGKNLKNKIFQVDIRRRNKAEHQDISQQMSQKMHRTKMGQNNCYKQISLTSDLE